MTDVAAEGEAEPLHPLRRPMGLETEFGIAPAGGTITDPSVLAALLVTAYARAVSLDGRRWDYGTESPRRDLRGFEMPRPDVPPESLTDEDPTTVNAVLTNGARFYVDHAHPEYSAPETLSPHAAVVWDAAGERVAARAAAEVVRQGGPPILLYKNNTDGKGASYGTHENYLVRRNAPLSQVIGGLTPFLVSRQVITGAGRVGIGPAGEVAGFQLSQRADFIEAEVGLETTIRRPIVNTRDEPHADPRRWRRLHLILGDATMAQTATFVKLATTSLVLAMVEAGAFATNPLALARPVEAMRRISRDPTLRVRVDLADGRELTALQLQQAYLDHAAAYVHDRLGDDREAREMLRLWQSLLDALADDPLQLSDTLDWPAKLGLLQRYRDRDGLDWRHPKLAMVDLQYSDLRPDKGLYFRLVAGGRMRTLVSEEEVQRAVAAPPDDTRAWFRGECIRRFGRDVVVASWDSLVFDPGPGTPLRRVPTLDPLRGTRALAEPLLDRAGSVRSLLALLERPES